MDSLQEVAAMAFLSVDDENAFNSLPSSMQKYVASVYFSRSFAEFSEELEVTIASAIDPDSSPVDREFLKSEVNKFILMSSVWWIKNVFCGWAKEHNGGWSQSESKRVLVSPSESKRVQASPSESKRVQASPSELN